MSRRVMVLAAVVLMAGCEQQGQTLPFEVGAMVSRTISPEGGSVSTPAGLAVHFPAGSLDGSVEVTLSGTAVPGAIEGVGEAASAAFALEPAGTLLGAPADLELKLGAAVDPGAAWLGTIVGVTGSEVRTYPAGRVDLGAGVVSAAIDRLGTMLVVIPSASMVFPVESVPSAALLPDPDPSAFLGASVEEIAVACGDAGQPCAGVEVSATQNLLDLVADAALIYPSIEGALQIGSTEVTGEIRASASLRMLLKSEQTAESVEVNAVLTPTDASTVIETDSEIRITNVIYRVSGSGGEDEIAFEEITTLIVPRTDSTGTVTFERTFEISTAENGWEPVTVAISFPVALQP